MSDRGGGARGRGRGRGWGRGRGHAQTDSVDEQQHSSSLAASTSASPLSPLQQRFYNYSQSLDAHNDKRERIYQTARDLIKAAKRVIFALQRPMTQQQLSTGNTAGSGSASTAAAPSSPPDSDNRLVPPHLIAQAEDALKPVWHCLRQLILELETEAEPPASASQPSTSVSSSSSSSSGFCIVCARLLHVPLVVLVLVRCAGAGGGSGLPALPDDSAAHHGSAHQRALPAADAAAVGAAAC